MNISRISFRRGFTLVELLTAMAITAVLVLVIGQLTQQSIDLWKNVREDVNSASASRVALQTMAHDLESFQLRAGANKFQWLAAWGDDDVQGVPKGLSIPRSARCVFFACAPDRNPSVSSSRALRGNYRAARAHNMETQGDVNAVSYRLMYRDQILNLPGSSKDDGGGMFPLFSLYRTVIPPRESYERLLGKEDLEAAYTAFTSEEEKNFLCENVLEMTLIFNIQYVKDSSDAESGRGNLESISVPIISSGKSQKDKKVEVYGDRISVGGNVLENARLVSADISITTLTEEGVALVEQVRKGRRRAPKPAEFFNKYTRSHSRSVALPQPL